MVVPPAVVGEFRLEEGRPGSSALRRAVEDGWIAVEEPSDDPLIRTLRQDLDLGESEAITLAVEKEAGLILLDEREGRRRARAVGLEVTGALGILARADRRGELDSLSGALDRLEDEAEFWIGSALRDQILSGPE